jgi:hypothetical protein
MHKKWTLHTCIHAIWHRVPICLSVRAFRALPPAPHNFTLQKKKTSTFLVHIFVKKEVCLSSPFHAPPRSFGPGVGPVPLAFRRWANHRETKIEGLRRERPIGYKNVGVYTYVQYDNVYTARIIEHIFVAIYSVAQLSVLCATMPWTARQLHLHLEFGFVSYVSYVCNAEDASRYHCLN